MAGKLQKKTSGILVSLLIGLLIVSFMFSGYNTMTGGAPDVVGKVGNQKIKIDEYRAELNRNIQMYKQIMGKEELSNKEIESFGIRKNALQGLINKKLLLSLATSVGVKVSQEEVKDEIKSLPYFKTNDQFDIEKYKLLLSSNKYTPASFEETIITDIQHRKIQSLLRIIPLSLSQLDDINKFKSLKKNITVTQFEKQNLTKEIKVSKKELNSFLEKEENIARIKNKFEQIKSTLNKPGKIKASHILIQSKPGAEDVAYKKVNNLHKKLTSKNFKKLANKNTDDPAGKTNGGSLGWFQKGRMVPEFDDVAFSLKKGQISNPVKTKYGYHIIYIEDQKKSYIATFQNHKTKLAKDALQKNKKEQLIILTDKLSKNITSKLKKTSLYGLEKLTKEYEIKLEKNKTINKYDGFNGSITISDENLNKIFKAKNNEIIKFDSPSKITIVKVTNIKNNKKITSDPTQPTKNQFEQTVARPFFSNILKDLNKSTKVQVFLKL